jgi:predicted nucleic acid-binding Zn ribbon protein
MIAIAKPQLKKCYTDAEVNAKYLELMPLIVKIAKHAFKDCDADRKADAIQSVLVAAFINLKQLAANGKLEDAYASPIAWYAVQSYKNGRHGGIPSNSRDVLSERCRLLGRSKVQYCGLGWHVTDSFESEATAYDARYPVDKQVQLKIDFFQTWYRNQSPRDQEIIKDLAIGETTTDLARKYKVSLGAVSQWRRKYANSWNEFINPKEEVDVLEELMTPAGK